MPFLPLREQSCSPDIQLDLVCSPVWIRVDCPLSARPERPGGCEGVLHELEERDLPIPHLRVNRERRSKQFADGNRAIGEGTEHSDVLAGTKEVGHGEVLDVPELGDPGKVSMKARSTGGCTGPGKDSFQFGIIEVERNLGRVVRDETAR